ncbi:hypothetical protein CBR_g30573 [Chara braunii]|uniref:H15 domain-containing protein n=1 Tax=Chara braunii TaxID=69332 RepID=A0A388LD40_CHABU|nr:hypothetical protein CBR_g30573 [Chara braunii]|eukprot:GBG80206.1 hypothetical protein CBR_g30573 [Chara braunii]
MKCEIYEEYILAAVSALKEKNGSSNSAIAKYIEDNHSVPPNFRRILASRLRSLTEEGKLIKLKQLYRLSDASFASRTGERPSKIPRRENQDGATAARRTPRPPKDFGKIAVKGARSDVILKGPRLVKAKPDFLSVRATSITAEEAARVAAQAVAEAEAAAAAAEQAARAAELAEAEAEAAEAAAEAAAAAVRPPKKRTNAKLKP